MTVKEHFKRHKRKYIAGSIVVFAGITYIIMRSNSQPNISRGIPVTASRGNPVTGESSVLNFAQQRTLFGSNSFNVTQVVDSYRKGAPSWVVRCLETGEAYMSQRAAALAMDLPESEISKHLNGIYDNVRGFTFERICLAA